MTTGDRLREWRKQRDLKQAEAADQAGISQSQWSGLETGKRTPSLAEAVRIQALTGGRIRVRMWLAEAA